MTDVYLYIYDLSMGMARLLSNTIIGRQFDGIWHTGVVVYDVEYFFCQSGITYCSPGSIPNAQLLERKLMGKTQLTKDQVQSYIFGLSTSLFKPGSYELLRHNCNSFSAHFVKHLTGKQIPTYITNLPSDFLETPIGSMFQGVMDRSASFFAPSSSSPFETQNRIMRRRTLPSTVRPILYDEPLATEFKPNELSAMFTGSSGIGLQWANSALTNLLLLSSSDLDSAKVSSEALSLLKFNRWATFEQCKAICEVFRLAVWRCPELILSLLTDPNESLHKFVETYPSPSGHISKSSYLDLDAAKCRLLCNILALTYDWDMAHLTFIPLEPVAALCIRLIRCEDGEGKSHSFKHSEKTPEHEMAGLALTVNFAMCPLVNESEAMEVAASLFHLLDVQKYFKHPTQACYALKAVYALTAAFSSLADLAKALEIYKYVPDLSSQAEHVEGDTEADISHVQDVRAITKKIMKMIKP